MPDHRYCLRWNYHQPNFTSTFSSLLTEECFVDVTLATEEKYIQAHKIILSACSTYFQKLFKVNPCQHPIVILKDVKYDDLKSIIDFIYRGEVSVSHEQLQSVLKTAVQLNIKGLADMPVTVSDKKIAEEKEASNSPSVSKKRKLKRSTRSSPAVLKSQSNEFEIVEYNDLSEYVRDEHSYDSLMNASDEPYNENPEKNNGPESCAQNKIAVSLGKGEDNAGGISVITGVKRRNRFLVRQNNLTVKNESGDYEQKLETCETMRPLIRQFSDPIHQNNPFPPDISTNTEKKDPKFLTTVPHLQKQNSDSLLSCSREDHQTSILLSDSLDPTSLLKNSPLKSNHCPTLRPGPALGCNFCWNTIDKQGRILRRKTKYHCLECRTNLCIVPCFQDYHSQKGNTENKTDSPLKEIIEESSDISQLSSNQNSSLIRLAT